MAAGTRGLRVRITASNYEKLRRLAAIYSARDSDGTPWTVADVAGVELASALSETTQEDVLAELGDARLTRAAVERAISAAAAAAGEE